VILFLFGGVTRVKMKWCTGIPTEMHNSAQIPQADIDDPEYMEHQEYSIGT